MCRTYTIRYEKRGPKKSIIRDCKPDLNPPTSEMMRWCRSIWNLWRYLWRYLWCRSYHYAWFGVDLEAAEIIQEFLVVLIIIGVHIFHLNVLLRVDWRDQTRPSSRLGGLFPFFEWKRKSQKDQKWFWGRRRSDSGKSSQNLTILEFFVQLRCFMFTELLFPEHFDILVFCAE